MRRKNLIRFRKIILVLAFFITLGVILTHRHIMIENFEEQILESLDDVSSQNKVVMEKEIADMQGIMSEIGVQIEEHYSNLNSEQNIREIVSFLEPFADIYHFKRMGIITLDGVAHCTDGYEENIYDHEIFVLGKKGISTITGSIMDTMGEKEYINILSLPLVQDNDKKIMGILFATIPTREFKEMINVEPFKGLGYSYVVEKDGQVVTDSEQSPMYGTTNIFESMLRFSQENISVVEEIEEDISKQRTGRVFFEADGKRYLHYAPLQMEGVNQNWYLCTIVTAEILDKRIASILELYDKMLAVAGGIVLVTVIYYMVTCSKDERTLRALAYVDAVTQGDNYACFLEKIKTKKGDKGFLISLDINEFKLVNGTCGIQKGNETLAEIWNVIKRSINSNELAAHINADHFVIFLQSPSRQEVITRIQLLTEDITKISSKLGIISIWPYFGIYETINMEDPEESYGRANQAKHLVRGNRQKNYAFYESLDYNKIIEEKSYVDCFDDAIANREFEMWYQPKYKSDGQTIVGAEALVRWKKKDGTMMAPYKFIPLFEKNGLITVLDEYVFRTVCMQQKKWEKEGQKLFPISINISRASLYYDNIVQKYKEILEECDVKPELVPLEITESATVDNAQIQVLVEDFRKVGFPMHLDDFGNGYSSLATLNLMQFDTLKLDKGLVDFIGDVNGEKLLSYTIGLAKSLGMRITAEGVEHKEQVDFLQNLECDEIQGYYFSKPLPLAEFEALIKQ